MGSLSIRSIEAAQQVDWERVDSIVARAKIVAKNDLWMQNSLASLEKYCRRRQREQFSKEAMYSADRMSKRSSQMMKRMSHTVVYQN